MMLIVLPLLLLAASLPSAQLDTLRVRGVPEGFNVDTLTVEGQSGDGVVFVDGVRLSPPYRFEGLRASDGPFLNGHLLLPDPVPPPSTVEDALVCEHWRIMTTLSEVAPSPSDGFETAAKLLAGCPDVEWASPAGLGLRVKYVFINRPIHLGMPTVTERLLPHARRELVDSIRSDLKAGAVRAIGRDYDFTTPPADTAGLLRDLERHLGGQDTPADFLRLRFFRDVARVRAAGPPIPEP